VDGAVEALWVAEVVEALVEVVAAALEDLEEEEMNMEPNTLTMSPFLPLNAAWS
jgi:hypothetical protein